MRIGLTARLLTLWAVVGLPCSNLAAQSTEESNYSPPQFSAMPGGQAGAVQALFTTPVGGGMMGPQQSPFIDAYGNPVILPASCAIGCTDGCADGVVDDYCPCSGPSVPMTNYGPDQCGPHYFDCRAEGVYITRDDSFTRNVNFTSLNVAGGIVLASSQLDYDYEPGFRIIGRYDFGPLSFVEFGYFGAFNWATSASFTDPNPVNQDTGNLFSLFSQFGTNPVTVALEGGPMPQTERSIRQSIALDSELQNAELSYRRYWVGFSPRISGTMLAGFRYTKLKENFLYHTEGEAALDYFLRADNDLAGLQTGGDVWVCLTQGLRIGAEGKVGIYNNHFDVATTIIATPPATPPALSERFRGDRVAFISEASADVVADILPSWSFRAGYEVLFLNTIVLAGENFNTASPYGLPGQAVRAPILNDQASAFYHGFHAGLEYVW